MMEIRDMVDKQQLAKSRLEELSTSPVLAVSEAYNRLRDSEDWKILFKFITEHETKRVVLLRASKSSDEVLKRQLDDKITMIGEFNEFINSLPNVANMVKSEIKDLEQFITAMDNNIANHNK